MLKSVFLAGRELNYPRNELMTSAIQDISRTTLIGSQSPTVYKGGIGSILRRSLSGFLRMFPRLIKGDFDFIFIGFFGQMLSLMIAPFTKKPIILDMFVSAYDTLVEDRQITGKKSLLSKFLLWLDKQSGKQASLVFVDTQAHVEYFHEAFQIPHSKMRRVFVGCDEQLFHPLPEDTESRTVLYYCSYLPLHGVDVVVRAAELLRVDPSTKFKIIGDGMDFEKVRQFVLEKHLTNVELAAPVSLERLPLEIQKSFICLGGHFGASAKACRVIPGKVFQMIAMGKPVIVGDNAANRELLTNGVDSLFCEMDNPEAIAVAIRTLCHDEAFRNKIASGAHRTYQTSASSSHLKSIVGDCVLETLNVRVD